MIRPTWDEYFMLLAKNAASRSTCISRPQGAVIVVGKRAVSTGYNGSMPGTVNCIDKGVCARRESGVTNDLREVACRAVHSEANAIAQAARNGINVDGGSIYCTNHPCSNCIRFIASAGIKKIFYELPYSSKFPERDKFFVRDAKESGLDFQQVKIRPEVLENIKNNILKEFTSERRID